MNINFNNKKLILLPATITCIISLLLVYKFTFPISWDVYYHIHMANLYMTNGLVFWDYSTVAPHGRLIMYPPLFHLFYHKISKASCIKIDIVYKFCLERIEQTMSKKIVPLNKKVIKCQLKELP